jgi:molybdenum cofactor guanylyltransferase
MANKISFKNIDSYILTGGQSRRFGSNKANFTINNQSFLEITKNTISPIFKNVYVVGKNKINDVEEKKYCLKDIFESQSPIVGLITILKHCKNEWCFVISVDMPFINFQVIQKLFNAIDNKYDIIIPKVNKKNMPLCGFYKKNNYEYILNSFKNGNLKLLWSIQSRNILEVEFDNNSIELSNINTKSELFNILDK